MNLLWLHAARGRRLIAPHVSDARVSGVTRAYRRGSVTYLGATLLAFVTATGALLLVAGVDPFYVLPQRGAHREDSV